VSSNVGRAGTLDLFKLYDETVYGSSPAIELSRILIKFDLDSVKALTSSLLNPNDQSFRAKIRMKSVSSGLPVPYDFTISSFPLARSFSEGYGRDVSAYSDVGASNFMSASIDNAWFLSGADAHGSIVDSNIDYYSSGNLGSGLVSLESKQYFKDGNEDLFIDVTNVISSTLAGTIDNNGFRLSFSGSQETDDITRFVKRFASRHVIDHSLRPTLEISYNDSINDSHENFYFDSTGSLFLRNYVGSSLSNVMSRSFEVTGNNCMLLTISTGSWSTTVSASQVSIGTSRSAGLYSSDIYVSAQDNSIVSGSITLAQHISSSGSIVFNETWKSIDGSVVYLSSYLTCSLPTRSAFINSSRDLIVKATNPLSSYTHGKTYKVRVFAYDPDYEPSAARVQKSMKSIIPSSVKYRLRADGTDEVYVPFDSGTKLSSDSAGLFFNMRVDGLPAGKLFVVDYLVNDRDSERVITDQGFKFRVEES
jgi:hypothetical protein